MASRSTHPLCRCPEPSRRDTGANWRAPSSTCSVHTPPSGAEHARVALPEPVPADVRSDVRDEPLVDRASPRETWFFAWEAERPSERAVALADHRQRLEVVDNGSQRPAELRVSCSFEHRFLQRPGPVVRWPSRGGLGQDQVGRPEGESGRGRGRSAALVMERRRLRTCWTIDATSRWSK